ncbi:MAG: hypothetical protein FJY17_00610 [Bacteroidetes bacterium]|nr:hypothetical protein [Bacteroidota bacterium]
MKIFEIILAANFFSFFFIVQNNFPEKWNLDFKPLNCTLCLTSWVALLLYLLPFEVTEATLCVFGAGMLSPYIRNFLTNLYESKRP